MVHDLMLVGVEARFGAACTAYPIVWLSDNGGAYIVSRQRHGRGTGAAPRPSVRALVSVERHREGVRQPKGREAKTLRREYVKLAIVPGAETAVAFLSVWFENGITVHPHSGSRFFSPKSLLPKVFKPTSPLVCSDGVHSNGPVEHE